MLAEQTIDKLNEMRLYGMSKSFAERHGAPNHQDLSSTEFVGLLVDDEYLYRENLRQKRLLYLAKLKISQATLEGVDYRHSRGLVKSRILSLQNTEWITNCQNILITGPTGVGKSYLACAFGQWACRHGYATLYCRFPRLLGDILSARGQGGYLRHLDRLKKVKLLIIDDFGLSSLTDGERKDFLEVIEDRYMVGSTILASQLPRGEWHTAIGEPTVADAICDRLFHNAHLIELKGESMRKMKAPEENAKNEHPGKERDD